MSGDYTRWSFDPTKNYSGVFKQQGRVDLDADWNESQEITDRRWRAETIDIIGRSIVPMSTPDAFNIKPTGPGQFTIGIGRMYVDGLLAECHGLPPLTYDASLGEQNGTTAVPFNQQPYYPSPSPLPSSAGAIDLIYLDVWHREVTAFEDPSIREKALGGPDATTREQTVWQVKVLPGVGAHACGDDITAWDDLIAPSAGRLTTSTVAPAPSPDPCVLSPTGGYRGLENRLYRVEVHVAGTVGGVNPARFKWSRDNASVVSAVESISAPGGPNSVVKLKSLGRDRVLRFKADDWVEILDDNLELGGAAGFLTKLIGPPDEANRTITVTPPIPAGMFDPSQPLRHTRVLRWDQKFTGAGSDVNPTSGLIDVAAGPLDIEDGIQVSFSDDPVGKTLHAGDRWLFAARTADGSVEALTKEPARGILHHYGRLGFVTWTATGGTFAECRIFWPPSFGTGEGCDCTVCVTPEGHNGGTATINKAATDTIAKGGGKVCLSPGLYFINQRVDIVQAASIEIVGHGLAFLTPGSNLAGGDPMIQIENSVDIRIEDLGFIALEAAGAAGQSLPGIVIQDSAFAAVQRCSFVGFRGGTTLSPAIGLGGTVLDSVVVGNLMTNVQTGVGPAPNRDKQRFLTFVSVLDNQMACVRGGIELVGSGGALSLNVGVRGNSIFAPVGVAFQGEGLDLTVESNAIVVVGDQTGSGTGIFSTISQTQIVNNDIAGVNTQAKSVGIELASTSMYGTQITGNRISALGGTGILFGEGAQMLETVVSRNQLLNLGKGGIVMASTASAADLTIKDNSLAFVAQTFDPTDSDQPFMVGIQVIAALNVNLDGNPIEDLGLDPNQTGIRAAVVAGLLSGLRIGSNRIQNIGPTGLKAPSGGVLLVFVLGRLDITDNEIRRALVPPTTGDTSDWTALVLDACVNDVSIRGNLLESFGVGLAAQVGSPKLPTLSPATCIFSENHCFLDNLPGLGVGSRPVVQITAQAIIAANNYAKGPSERGTIDLNGPFNTANNTLTGPITVVGNLTTGAITVNGSSLPANPFGPLNVLLP
jgi:hypothetical protein